MITYLRIAVRNLLQSRRRTLFLSTALFMVTTLLVLLLSWSQGLTDTMIRSATTLSSGHVNVAGFYKARPTDAVPVLTGAGEIRRIVEEEVEGIAAVIDRQRGWARLVSESSSLYSVLKGVDISEEIALKETVILAPENTFLEGSTSVRVGSIEDLLEPDSLMLFESQAKRLAVGIGDTVTITTETPEGATNTVDARVVAVAQDMGLLSNWSVFLPRKTVQDLYRLAPDTTGAVMIYLQDPDRADAVMTQLQSTFEARGYQIMDHVPQPFFMKFETVSGEDWTGQKLDLTVWQDEVSFLQWILTAVDTVSGILIGILTVIIAIGIMNALWIAVRERTQEIGTLRAIGMRRLRVLQMFMSEALLLGFVSTSAGSLAGATLATGIDAARIKIPVDAMRAILMSDTLHLSVRPVQLAFAVVMFTTITALAALWPAIRATRMQPITAIHHVG